MFTLQHRHHKQAGFTLIEALVALVVMGFGLLAVAGMQLNLARNADVAKQRTEAIRLAQEKIEALRSFTSIASISAGDINWNELATSSDVITPANYLAGATNATNATYTRNWTLGGVIADPMRTASVTVTWNDRAGEAQSVTLATVLSKSDPSDSGFLTFPLPQNTNLKRPKNRNINVPVPAIDLGGGKSALKLATNLTIVFSDISGSVVQKCTGNVTATDYAAGAGNGATVGCTDYPAFLLAGYVSGSLQTTVVTGNPNNPIPNDSVTMPTGINTSNLTGWDSSGGKTISCVYRVASDQTTGVEIPTLHYYLCVIPVTASGTGSAWSGTVRLGGVKTTDDRTKVCRFQYAASSFLSSNMRNVQAYSNVNESLDNQNYYIESSTNDSCPSISSSECSSNSPCTIANGGIVATTMHQNCRSSKTPSTIFDGTCPLATHNTGP